MSTWNSFQRLKKYNNGLHKELLGDLKRENWPHIEVGNVPNDSNIPQETRGKVAKNLLAVKDHLQPSLSSTDPVRK